MSSAHQNSRLAQTWPEMTQVNPGHAVVSQCSYQSDARRFCCSQIFCLFFADYFYFEDCENVKRAAASPMDNSEKQKRKHLSLSIAQKVTAGIEVQTRDTSWTLYYWATRSPVTFYLKNIKIYAKNFPFRNPNNSKIRKVSGPKVSDKRLWTCTTD